MVKYGTLEHYKALKDALNNDEEFTKSGLSTTMIFRFSDRKNASGGMLSFMLTVDKGKVLDATEVGENDKAEFVGTATYAVLADITKGKQDPMQAQRYGILDYKFPILKALRYNRCIKRISALELALQSEY